MRTFWCKFTVALTIVLLGGVTAWAKPIPAEVQAALRDWYARYLGRAPEPAALEFWGAKLAESKHPVDVEASILASAEYYERHGRNPASFVRGLYRDVVGTEATPEQVDFWLSKVYELRERDKFLREFMTAARKMPPAPPTGPKVVPPAAGPVRTPPAQVAPAQGAPTRNLPLRTVPEGFSKPLPAYQRN
jgi:hypothetical protein